MKRWLVWLMTVAAMTLSGLVMAEAVPPDEAADQEVPANVIYRTRLPDGSFKLSDEPVNDSSEKLVLPALPPAGSVAPVRRAPSPAAMPEEREKPVFVAADYTLAITAPENGQAFVHPETVSITTSLTPALPEGYRLELLHGGSPIEGSTLQMPSRGGHVVQARVLGPDGNVVLSSAEVQFTVLRPSRLIN